MTACYQIAALLVTTKINPLMKPYSAQRPCATSASKLLAVRFKPTFLKNTWAALLLAGQYDCSPRASFFVDFLRIHGISKGIFFLPYVSNSRKLILLIMSWCGKSESRLLCYIKLAGNHGAHYYAFIQWKKWETRGKSIQSESSCNALCTASRYKTKKRSLTLGVNMNVKVMLHGTIYKTIFNGNI